MIRKFERALLWVMFAGLLAAGVSDGVTRIRSGMYVCNGECGTPATATAEGDLYVEDALEVDGAADFDGSVTVGAITGANAGTIDNGTNGAWTIAEASEDLVCTFTSNTLTLSSTTGVASLVFSGIAPSLTVVSGANTACDTTCGVSLCVAALDAGASAFVACSAATADHCLCTGSAS